MKKSSLSIMLICALVLTVLSACGGGGGGGDIILKQPTSAVLTLSTAATSTIPATTTINSYNVTIILPAGVTVKSTVSPPETDANVVTASGKATGASIIGVYTAATGTFPATVKLSVVKVDPITGAGFDPGEFCTVTCDIAAGHYPVASSFVQPTLDDVSGFDTISTSTVTTLAGQLSLTSTAAIN